VQKIAYNLQDLNAERMEHGFCGPEFLLGNEVDENFQTSQETRRTKRKSNNDDDDDDKIPQIWRNYRVYIRVEPFVYL